MDNEYIEMVTPKGLLLRVNLKHGTFLVFKEGVPISVSRVGGISQIHSLTHVYFLGNSFELPASKYDAINFFMVERGFMMIPFVFAGVSDVRHIRIRIAFEADMLPALAVQFGSYWPGPLPPVGEGRRFFVADPEISRKEIVRIKNRYPAAKLMIYRADEPASIRIEHGHAGSRKKDKRAIDLVERSEAKLFAQNPVFAARVYLRQLDWKRLFSLPLYGKMEMPEIESILEFLKTMQAKSKERESLQREVKNIDSAISHFSGLMVVFKMEMKPVKEFAVSEKNSLGIVKDWLDAQHHFYAKDGKTKQSQFFMDALHLIARESGRASNVPADKQG